LGGFFYASNAMSSQFATGDSVTLICGGETSDGEISLASQNGRWLIVRFGAVINGHIGVMPLEQQADGSYRSLANGATVKVSPKNSTRL
jgi:hypothetical protein